MSWECSSTLTANVWITLKVKYFRCVASVENVVFGNSRWKKETTTENVLESIKTNTRFQLLKNFFITFTDLLVTTNGFLVCKCKISDFIMAKCKRRWIINKGRVHAQIHDKINNLKWNKTVFIFLHLFVLTTEQENQR